MPSLQDHMLRVAAVASLICDNFDEPLPKEEIISACLLHDMGNIIKSDLKYFPEFLEPQGLDYWQEVKDEYIQKYGKNELQATVQIIQELGLSNLLPVFGGMSFAKAKENLAVEDFAIKICFYADLRVDPHGVVSYEGRMEEGKKRYQNRTDVFSTEGRDYLVQCGKEIEKQIFAKCKIKPEDINNETAAPIILSLRGFVIK